MYSDDDLAAHVADELRSERVCPRHGIPIEPSIMTKEGKDSYEMSCSECEYEQMFRGTPPAIAPRHLTLEEFTRLIPADWRESLQLTGRIPSEPAGGGGRRELR